MIDFDETDIVEWLEKSSSVEWCSQMLEKAAKEIKELRADRDDFLRLEYRNWYAIPDEFKLSPSDGGGIDTFIAIEDMAKEIERLRAELSKLKIT